MHWNFLAMFLLAVLGLLSGITLAQVLVRRPRPEPAPGPRPVPFPVPEPGPGPRLVGRDGSPFPLQALEARARITGPLASVELRQRFANPHDRPIEAIYIFPLPGRAAVYDFRMVVGDRVLQGQVKARSQARQAYVEAIGSGRQAALMEQERDNVFTVSVGNLPPGQEVTIELSYAERLEVSGGQTEFRFPVVVAQRYMPGTRRQRQPQGDGVGADTSQVPDASRISPPRSSGAEFRFSLQVWLETGGLPLASLWTGHKVTQLRDSEGVRLELVDADHREFVMRYAVKAENQLFTWADHFLLTVFPPEGLVPQRTGRDLVILLDRSGSMQGANLEVARAAVARLFSRLTPDDRFGVLAFDTQVEGFSGGELCEHARLSDAGAWVKTVQARGGTEIAGPLRQALAMPRDPGRPGCLVLITDGQVGNEEALYQEVQGSIKGWRIFTLGIDNNVNDAFLRRLAGLGQGTCELVIPSQPWEAALDRLADELGYPLVRGIRLSGPDLDPDSLTPHPLPDLYSGRPLMALGQGSQALHVSGLGGFALEVQPCPSQNPALAQVWARERVTVLEDRMRSQHFSDRAGLEKEILDLCLAWNLISRFTAFVVVDEATQVEQPPVKLVQPVCQPSQGCAKKPESVVQLMQVDPLVLELGKDLLSLVDPCVQAPLMEILQLTRQQLSAELGFPIPGMRVRDNLSLAPNEYIFKVKEIVVARGRVETGALLAIGPKEQLLKLGGPLTCEPVHAMPALAIRADQHEQAESLGCLVVTAVQVIASHLAEVVRCHGADLLGRQETQALAGGQVPPPLSLGEVQVVLQDLLRETVSLRELDVILGALGGAPFDRESRLEDVRLQLRESILAPFVEGDRLRALVLEQDLEERLEVSWQGSALCLDPAQGQRILQALGETLASHPDLPPVLVTRPAIRRAVSQLTRRSYPQLAVISHSEIPERIRLEVVDRVWLPVPVSVS